MEKTIKIGEQQVRFKATAGLSYRYYLQFGKEYAADLAEMQNFIITDENGNKSYDFSKYNQQVIYNLIWVMAKTADDNIPDPLTWLDSFDASDFNINEIFSALQPLIAANNKTTTKN